MTSSKVTNLRDAIADHVHAGDELHVVVGHSRWTAALVKQNDGWKVAAFHVSTNMFDNGVSNLMIKWAAIKTGAAALAIGIVCGVLGAVFWKRRKA